MIRLGFEQLTDKSSPPRPHTLGWDQGCHCLCSLGPYISSQQGCLRHRCCVSLFNHDVSFAFALACDQLELQPRQHLVLLFSGTPTGKRSTECVRVRLRVCFIFEIRKKETLA